MNPDFEMVVEDCLVRLRTGTSVESCLSFYPEQAEELRPLLTAAVQVRAIPNPQARSQAIERNRQRMFVALEQQNWAGNTNQTPISKSSFSRYTERILNFLRIVLVGKERIGMKFALRLALDLAIFLAVAGAFTLNASASTLPGDPLYNVKRTWEEVRLTLITSDQARQQLQTQLEAERRTEIEKLIQLHRPVMVEYMGILEQMGTDTWIVSGLQFKMLPETIVQGIPAVGQHVWLRASVQSDGQLVALEVHMENAAAPAIGPTGTNVNPVRSTSTPWPVYHGTSMPGPMPWSTMMPYYYDDNHNTWSSPTNAPAIAPTQQPAPTNQYHSQPAPTQWPNDDHHQNPNKCRDCSHNNWNNHDNWSGGGGRHH